MSRDYVYIVSSATPYSIGRAIRKLTGHTRNHISIALDEDLKRMYGFARRYYRMPLYGGFVRESLSRYHVNGITTTISIYRLPVTVEQYTALEKMLTEMEQNPNRYLYNHLSILGSPVRWRIRVRDAYTCVEFCVNILNSLGLAVDTKKYYSVSDVEKLLQAYNYYTGPIPTGEEFDEAYYAKNPVPNPAFATVRSILGLLPRLEV